MVAVEVWQGTLRLEVFAVQVRQGTLDMAGGSRLRADSTTTRKEGRKEGRRKETTDIKSNNPHRGGETESIKLTSHN